MGGIPAGLPCSCACLSGCLLSSSTAARCRARHTQAAAAGELTDRMWPLDGTPLSLSSTSMYLQHEVVGRAELAQRQPGACKQPPKPANRCDTRQPKCGPNRQGGAATHRGAAALTGPAAAGCWWAASAASGCRRRWKRWSARRRVRLQGGCQACVIIHAASGH